jgi:hypothetical protein
MGHWPGIWGLTPQRGRRAPTRGYGAAANNNSDRLPSTASTATATPARPPRAPTTRVNAGQGNTAYEKIAAAARCARSSVAVALRAREDAGLLSWVHRLARIRRRERDLFGHLVSVWQVIRVSNGYRFTDPLDREPRQKSL